MHRSGIVDHASRFHATLRHSDEMRMRASTAQLGNTDHAVPAAMHTHTNGRARQQHVGPPAIICQMRNTGHIENAQIESTYSTAVSFFLRPDPRRRSRRASGCRGNNVPPRTNVSHSTVADPEPPPPLSSSHANLGGFARLESRIWRACCPKLSPRTRRASDTFVSERQREGKGVYLPGYLRVGETGFVECRAFERVPI